MSPDIRFFCGACGKPIVFPASSGGRRVLCPECGKETDCPAAKPEAAPSNPHAVWFVVGVLLQIAALMASATGGVGLLLFLGGLGGFCIVVAFFVVLNAILAELRRRGSS